MAWKYEAVILREFTRRAHHFSDDLPQAQDVLEWFALMRHYTAPCRLVDFTYSFYSAAYFALKDAADEPAAIWAVNTDWLRECYEGAWGESDPDFRFKNPAKFRLRFLDTMHPQKFVAPANPFRLNQRLTAQQGIFLCPGDINHSFMDNLLAPEADSGAGKVVRILVSAEAKNDAIEELRRMNISSATLFPDLIGFAESLGDWFVLPINFRESDLRMAIEGRFPNDASFEDR